MASLQEYVSARELLVNLTLRELRSKYKKSVLGWTWSLLNPLSSVVIYTIVFSGFLHVQAPTGDPSGLQSFVFFLLCALIPWNFVAGSISLSLETLVANGNLIKKVYFPRELLVAATIASLLVTFAIELGVVCVILLIAGNMVLPWIPVAIVLMALLTCTVLGVGLILSVTNVYFRDVKHFVNIALQALFYSAPIVYPATLVPKESTILGRDCAGALHLRVEPAGPLRRGLPRRALQPPLPELDDVSVPRRLGSGLARGRAVGLQQARAAFGGRGMSAGPVITVDHVSKRFRLYHERNQSLKASVSARRPGALRGVLGAQ